MALVSNSRNLHMHDESEIINSVGTIENIYKKNIKAIDFSYKIFTILCLTTCIQYRNIMQKNLALAVIGHGPFN